MRRGDRQPKIPAWLSSGPYLFRRNFPEPSPASISMRSTGCKVPRVKSQAHRQRRDSGAVNIYDQTKDVISYPRCWEGGLVWRGRI